MKFAIKQDLYAGITQTDLTIIDTPLDKTFSPGKYGQEDG